MVKWPEIQATMRQGSLGHLQRGLPWYASNYILIELFSWTNSFDVLSVVMFEISKDTINILSIMIIGMIVMITFDDQGEHLWLWW